MQPSSVNNSTKVVYGDRIGRQGELRLGCSAILFDNERQAVLLTRRADNGQWCLPGGKIDPGESVAEGCVREFFEETGLLVRVVRLVGVYSNPNRLIVYPEGNKAQVVVLNFEVEKLGGEMALSTETTGIQFFTVAEALQMDLFHSHTEHIRDALVGMDKAFIR